MWGYLPPPLSVKIRKNLESRQTSLRLLLEQKRHDGLILWCPLSRSLPITSKLLKTHALKPKIAQLCNFPKKPVLIKNEDFFTFSPKPLDNQWDTGYNRGVMDTPVNSAEITQKTELAFEFPEKPKITACSSNICTNGHEWQPETGLTGCPGCQSPMLVLRTVQCPICNEPIAKVRLRTDHLPKGGAVTPICKGSDSLAEVLILELERHHYTKEQETHKVREMPAKV